MADGKKFFPAPRLILLAVLAGVATGAVAVYVSGPRSGNKLPASETAAQAEASATEVAACQDKAEKARAVGEAAAGEVAAMLPADPPQSLMTLTFNGPDSKPMTLADLSGKTLLVNLWATWCAPCRAEMPALNALQREAGGENFEVVAVNVDTGDDVKPKKFLAETKVDNLAFYRENTLALFNDLQKRGLVLGLPVTLLVDRDGCLLAHMNGPAEWASDDAKALVAKAVNAAY